MSSQAATDPPEPANQSTRSVALPLEPSASDDAASWALRLLPVVQRVCELGAEGFPTPHLERSMAREVAAMLHADVAIAARVDDTLVIGGGTERFAASEGEVFPLEGGFLSRALREGQLATTDDLPSEPDLYVREATLRIGPLVCAPLRTPTDPYGVLLVARTPGADAFSGPEREAISRLGAIIAPVLAGAQRCSPQRESRRALEAWRREQSLLDRSRGLEDALTAAGLVCLSIDRAEQVLTWRATPEVPFAFLRDRSRATFQEWVEQVHPADRDALLTRLDSLGDAPARLAFRLRTPTESRAVVLTTQPAPAAAAVITGVLRIAGSGRSAEENRIREILRAVRHEVNNPLAILLGELQLLRRARAGGAAPTNSRAVDTIHDSARRIEEVVAHLSVLEQAPLEQLDVGSGPGLPRWSAGEGPAGTAEPHLSSEP